MLLRYYSGIDRGVGLASRINESLGSKTAPILKGIASSPTVADRNAGRKRRRTSHRDWIPAMFCKSTRTVQVQYVTSADSGAARRTSLAGQHPRAECGAA
jgi:hypothetical protein